MRALSHVQFCRKMDQGRIFLAAYCHLPSIHHGTAHSYDGCHDNNHVPGLVCTLNTYIAIKCEANYVLIGAGILQCAGNDQWSHPIPSCESKF